MEKALTSNIGRRRRVLIVASAFQPVMIADMQRTRLLAWDLAEFGWDVEVLAPLAKEVRQDAIEPDSEPWFSSGTKCHGVSSIARGLFEALGSRTHAWRTLWPMYKSGHELLATGRFDLVYFSTTTWIYCALGPLWRRLTRVPYVLDFHDPWSRANGRSSRIRRSWRSRASEALTRQMERVAVMDAEGLVAVSPTYLEELVARYGQLQPRWLAVGRHAVIPFGVRPEDLVEAGRALKNSHPSANDTLRINYVGAGGPVMVRSFALICRALAALRAQGNRHVERVRIGLFGTIYGWRQGDVRHLAEVARAAGVADLVSENPERVSYRRSLELLLEGDAALVLGVDDAGYMPSKLFTYALSGKALLASLHSESPAFDWFRQHSQAGHVLWFSDDAEIPLNEAAAVVASFLTRVGETYDRGAALAPNLAWEMARRHARLFSSCIDADAEDR